uniref:Uncharacterized protein n=1 Tax=Amphimedon queenslandica TaxID=400682 RepID=A0A1X7T6H1_AMPQE
MLYLNEILSDTNMTMTTRMMETSHTILTSDIRITVMIINKIFNRINTT